MGLWLDLTSGSLKPQLAIRSLLYLKLTFSYDDSRESAGDSRESAGDSSESAGDSSESAGDIGKDYQGFLREHVTLYPTC